MEINTKPKSLNELAIPGVLDALHTEWDTLALETFELRKHLDFVKKQLVHAMYYQDAATRVISRLMKERDEARQSLSITQEKLLNFKEKLETNGGTEYPVESLVKNDNENDIEQENCGIYPELTDKMDEISKSLFAERKNKKKPDDYYSPTDFNNFKERGSYPLHSSSIPGVLSLDIHKIYTSFILTGGSDGKAVIFDKNSQNVICSMINEHDNSSILGVEYSRNGVLLTRSNGKAEYWTTDLSSEYWALKRKISGVGGIIAKAHPLDPYFIFSTANNSWGFFNMETGSKLAHVELENNEELTCVTVHPDGLMMATGSNVGTIKLWDIRTQTVVATLEEHKNPVKSLKFSEKAIHLASISSNENEPLIWNLKKLNQSPPHRLSNLNGHFVSSIDFDPYGQYVISSYSNNIAFYETSNPNSILYEFEAHNDIINSVKFSMDGSYIASCSQDRFLKIFSL